MRLTLPLAVAAALDAIAGGANAARACNGHSELCDRRYTNVTFVGAHDSPFVGDELADNQNVSIADQLAMGVRFLQGQTHYEGGVIKLCHSLCALRDAGPLENMLDLVKAFLDANPGEVVTLLLTNEGGVSRQAFAAVFRNVGLEKYAFPADPTMGPDEWPTLGEMIDTGKRLVVFMDYPKGPPVPFILDELSRHIAETPFEFDDLDDLSFCSVDRPPRISAQDRMLLMNHWLQLNASGILVPRRCMAVTTNSEEYILRHVKSCQIALQKKPNLILLDWIDVGDGMLIQESLNGFEPTRTRQNEMPDPEQCERDPDLDPPIPGRRRRRETATQELG